MEEKVQCQICGKYFRTITSTHLKKHGMTVKEYKELYSDAEIVSNNTREKRIKALTGREISSETRYRCGNGSRGRVQTEEEKEKRRQSAISSYTSDVQDRRSRSLKAVYADGSVVVKRNKTIAKNRFLVRFFEEMRMLEQLAYGNLVQCEICGECWQILSGSHLKSHGITSEEYKQRFPSSKLYTEKYSRMISANFQGISYDEWESFATGQEYCPKFNNDCRESNRYKYDRRCFMCDLSEEDNVRQRKLSVHHVDMNRDQGCNGHGWKLVPLCPSCHRKAHTKTWIARIEYLLNNVWM